MTKKVSGKPAGAAPRVRMADEADAAACAEVYAPVVLGSPASFELVPPDAEEMARRLRAVLAGGRPWLVAESQGGDVLGYCYAAPLRDRAAYAWTVTTSVYVAGSAIGRGVGRTLYDALLPELVARGFVQALAGISLPNAASVALHEGCGFRPIGVERAVGYKFGAWHDVGWWQRTLRDPPATPTPPLRGHPTTPPH